MEQYPVLLVYQFLAHIMLAFGASFKDILDFPPGSGFATKKQKWCSDFNIPPGSTVISIGFFGDGVPLQQRSSIEVFSWNICTIPRAARNLFTCIPKQDLCDCGCRGRCTIDAILDMFQWSMLPLLTNEYPEERHDGKPWEKTDKERSKQHGALGLYGHLSQCRGDWAWIKKIVGFKGWTSSNHVCWRCEANHTTVPYWDTKPTARWMRKRCSQMRFFELVKENNAAISPLFSVPGFHIDYICIDVLHCLDLGVTQDIVGNIFFECLGTFALGRSRKEQMENLTLKLKDHYKRMKTTNRINVLTIEMVNKYKKHAKLRAKGAESRHVVPFAVEIATAMCALKSDKHWKIVLDCVSALLEFYLLLAVRPFPIDDAKAACEKCCSSRMTLSTEAEKANKPVWRKKPKLHLFMELGIFQVEELGDPQSYWNYKDEDCVGLCADIGESRGGPSTVSTVALRIIQRVRALFGQS